MEQIKVDKIKVEQMCKEILTKFGKEPINGILKLKVGEFVREYIKPYGAYNAHLLKFDVMRNGLDGLAIPPLNLLTYVFIETGIILTELTENTTMVVLDGYAYGWNIIDGRWAKVPAPEKPYMIDNFPVSS